MHRDFVSAIFEVGLMCSSPDTISMYMPNDKRFSSEIIKSQLQKYRQHWKETKSQILPSIYDTYINIPQNKYINYSIPSCYPYLNRNPLYLPILTEAEKNSLVGVSMKYLLGLFINLKQQLLLQRSRRNRRKQRIVSLSSIKSINIPQKQQQLSFSPLFSTNLPLSQSIHSKNTLCTIDTSSIMFNDQYHSQNNANLRDHKTSFVHRTESSVPVIPKQKTVLQDQPHEVEVYPLIRVTTAKKSIYNKFTPLDQSIIGEQCLSQKFNDKLSKRNSPYISFDESIFITSQNTRIRRPLEETNIMKREMQDQMVFQNKIRKLKENERRKCTSPLQTKREIIQKYNSKDRIKEVKSGYMDVFSTGINYTDSLLSSHNSNYCGTKMKKNNENKSDIFWKPDIDDNQLFEFLLCE